MCMLLADLMCFVDEMAMRKTLQATIRVWRPLSRKGANRVKLVDLMAQVGRLIPNQELLVAAERDKSRWREAMLLQASVAGWQRCFNIGRATKKTSCRRPLCTPGG